MAHFRQMALAAVALSACQGEPATERERVTQEQRDLHQAEKMLAAPAGDTSWMNEAADVAERTGAEDAEPLADEQPE